MRIPSKLPLLVALTLPSWAPAQWPQFRGPEGQGHAEAQGLPLYWSETKNVVWKVPVPGSGWSSPVISGDQIWMTTAQEKGRSLRAICLERRSGRVIHNVEVLRRERPGPVHAKNSHATPTPVLDKDRVYVHFGDSGTACLKTNGKVIWKTTTLEYHQPYAGVSSPVLFRDLLILSCDGADQQFMAALDKRNGNIVWKKARQHLDEAVVKDQNMPPGRRGFSFMAYSTPLVIAVNDGPQLVSTAADHVAAYNPSTGKEIWWSGYDGFSLVARPVYGHGLVFVIGTVDATRPVLYAIRPQARGKVTEKHLAWRLAHGVPHVPSPLLVGAELYMVNDGGIATCVDARTGRVHWKERLGGNYSASPIYGDGKLYFFSEEGMTTVLAPGKQFRLLAGNRLDGRFLTSPAVAGRALFLRTDSHLYRIQAIQKGKRQAGDKEGIHDNKRR